MLRRWFAFVGIDLGEKGFFPMRLRRRFGGFVALGLLLMAVGSGTFFWQSSKSWFCNSCHIMRPYVESWKESTHGQEGVECIQCHFPLGFKNAVAAKFQAASMAVAFITGTYDTAPFAEVQDASCMRPGCHEKRLLEGEVDFDGVSFNHKTHLGELRRGKKLRCQTCHSQIVQGSHITVTKSVCFTCHFKDLKHGRVEEPVAGCTGCHKVPDKPVKTARGGEYNHADYPADKVACYKCHFDTVQGDGHVPKQVCLGCHKNPDHLARFDDHEFMHKNHVTDHKVECFHCHDEIRHGRDPEPEKADPMCNRCHERKHDLTGQLYSGKGARGVDGTPSIMWKTRVQCIGCHQTLGGIPGHAPHATYEANEKSCVACHGEDGKGMLADWKTEIAEALKEATAVFAKAETAAKSIAAEDAKAKAAKLLDDARYNLDFVRYAKGVHNMEYALSILEAVGANAEKVVELSEAK